MLFYRQTIYGIYQFMYWKNQTFYKKKYNLLNFVDLSYNSVNSFPIKIKIMEILKSIQRRYSVRKYASDTVEREKLERCLEAARMAPSACNAQPWKFIVVDDPNLKEQIGRAHV